MASVGFDSFLSVVVPLRDFGQSLEPFVEEIDLTVRASFQHYEIILIDDASEDDTVAKIKQLQAFRPNIQLYCLHRRSGLDAALVAGLDNSIGDFVITLNPETDPIPLIPGLWREAQAGIELVCGVRGPDRGWLAARKNRLFYRAYFAATGLRIPPGASDARLYSRRVVSFMTTNNDRHLLLKVLPFFATNRASGVSYDAVARTGGFGGRSFSAELLMASVILLASSARPLRFLTFLSLTSATASLLYAIYILGVALIKKNVVEGWISLAFPMAVMFFFVSVILGILSEYMYLLVQQSGNRPVYSIASESTSSVLEIQRKLNVVHGDSGGTDAGAKTETTNA